ncbi:MAG TPA: hypothetical protein VIS99_09630 [Terrimicrobiaceae bacterium]
MTTILFQTGGPFHPVDAQVTLIQRWLPSDWKIRPAFGTDVFEQLEDAASTLPEVSTGPGSRIYRR